MTKEKVMALLSYRAKFARKESENEHWSKEMGIRFLTYAVAIESAVKMMEQVDE